MAVWLDEPDIAPVDDRRHRRDRGRRPSAAAAGATVDFDARPAFDPAEANDTYLQLLLATMSARDPGYDRIVEQGRALEPGDDQPRTPGTCACRPPATATWPLAAEARDQQRWAWRAFFQDHDVLLAPITATPPFPHDHSEPLPARTMTVNGAEVPYFGQLFWAGLAISAYLPATAVPVGRTADGLPVGMQIIGDALPRPHDHLGRRPAGQADRRVTPRRRAG